MRTWPTEDIFITATNGLVRAIAVTPMRRQSYRIITSLACASLGAAAACVTIRPVLVDQKTEIEHQLLGRFERLEQELRLATPSSDGGGEQGRNRAALQALLDRQLNVAALDELKQHKLVGEAKDGQCLWIGPPDDPQRAVARRLLARENTARRALLQALIAAEPGLRPTDMPAVRRAFHRIQLALAKPGDRVQRSDGRWRTVGDSP